MLSLQFFDEITFTATAQQITSTSSSSLIPSFYDTDEFTNEQRFQLCRRSARLLMRQKIRVELLEHTATGMASEYYVLLRRSNRKTSEVFVQAFDCPTEPKIYIHFNKKEKERKPWVILKDSHVQQRYVNILSSAVRIFGSTFNKHNLRNMTSKQVRVYS
jgi:hypothetical protein